MLASGNILLRAVEPEDANFLFEMENNPDVWNVSNNLAPYSRYQIEQYVLGNPNDIVANKQLRLIIEYEEKPALMAIAGAVDLYDVDLVNRRAGIGIVVLDQYRGRGIAKMALHEMIRYCSSHLRLVQIFCSVAGNNKASIRLFTGAGFIGCGVRKKWFSGTDGWQDEFLFQRFLANE